MARSKSPAAAPARPLAVALAAAREKIRRESPEHGTQVAIAKVANVRQASVSGWERGVDMPGIKKLPDVARAYRVPLRRVRALWWASKSASAAA